VPGRVCLCAWREVKAWRTECVVNNKMLCRQSAGELPGAHLGEAVQDLPAGQSLGEGLDGVLAVQEDDRIAGLRCRQESSDTTACTCRCWRATCRARSCKKCSADSAPRVPPEKLSMKRTQRRSSGTQVPPDVTHTTGCLSTPAVTTLCECMHQHWT